MEGKKMSKSLGNIIPLRHAIEEYGADSIRLTMLASAEILQDSDFSFDLVKGIRSKLFEIYRNINAHLDIFRVQSSLDMRYWKMFGYQADCKKLLWTLLLLLKNLESEKLCIISYI